MFFLSPFRILTIIMIGYREPKCWSRPYCLLALITSATAGSLKFRGEELIFWRHPASGWKYRKMAIAGPLQLTKGPLFHYVSLFTAYFQRPLTNCKRICVPLMIFLWNPLKGLDMYCMCVYLLLFLEPPLIYKVWNCKIFSIVNIIASPEQKKWCSQYA